MPMPRCLPRLVAALLLALALIPAARAQVLLELSLSSLTVEKPGTGIYTATATNLGASAVDLEGIATTLGASGLTFDDSGFFAFFAGPLPAGGSIVAKELFRVEVAASAANGTYNEAATLLDANGDPVASAFFQLVVSGTTILPEPSTGAYLAAGGLAILAGRARRNRRPRRRQ